MNYFLELFDLIGILSRRRYKIAEQYFSTLGFNHTEARLLIFLEQENGRATQDALSSMLSVDRSNAGRGLKRLEQGGYIKRGEYENNKKTKLVWITAKGREAAEEISKLKKKMAKNFFGDLKEDEAEAVLNLLQKIL